MFFKNSKGRNVVRVTDTTDHGGEVLTGSEIMNIYGLAAARVGDMVRCPKCNGTYPIVEGDEMVNTEGRRVAFDGHLTACGARLISSLGSYQQSSSNFQPTNLQSGGDEPEMVRELRERAEYYETNKDQIHRDYEKDREHILSEFEQFLTETNAQGLRREGSGFLNAYLNNLQGVDTWTGDVIAFFGGTLYERCHGLSTKLAQRLSKIELKLRWAISMVVNKNETHYWVAAIPQFYSDVGYKTIVLDPLYGTAKDSTGIGGTSVPFVDDDIFASIDLNDPEQMARIRRAAEEFRANSRNQ